MTYFKGLNNLSAPPIGRAAYSDRMAWIMAELSSLVYLELPPEKDSTSIVDYIKHALDANKTSDAIKRDVRTKFSKVSSDKSDIETQLENINKEILNKITLLEAFVVDDSEAILIKFEQDKDIFYALAFRGTSSPHDVKTDIDINLGAIDENNPKRKAHRGFYKNY
jgi:hypothetical protein